jgi:hypothetical protein
MREQEEYLLDFAERWKVAADQTDDILVIGVRL